MDSDSALRLLGERSRWQLQRYAVYSIGFGIPFSWMLMSVVFIGECRLFGTCRLVKDLERNIEADELKKY